VWPQEIVCTHEREGGGGGDILGFNTWYRHSGVVKISHMLFVDDIFVFCEAKLDHLPYLCALFLCFEASFGLRIKLAKLEMFLVGNVENVDGLIGLLGCGVSSLPLKYFGLLLRAHLLRPSLFGIKLLKR
jgi:hypothetical protein